MQLISNPPNPFLSEVRELLGPAPTVAPDIFEEKSKSILSRNDSPDLPFRWSLNPYQGCFHACAYCYARPSHEYRGFGAGQTLNQNSSSRSTPQISCKKRSRNPPGMMNSSYFLAIRTHTNPWKRNTSSLVPVYKPARLIVIQ